MRRLSIGGVCALLSLAVWIQCSGDLAGGGSEGEARTTVSAAGIVDGTTGRIAVGAEVYLRDTGYCSTRDSGYNALVDASGSFAIDNVQQGTYLLEVRVAGISASVARVVVEKDVPHCIVPIDTLQKTGSVAGFIDSSGNPQTMYRVQVPGLERMVDNCESGSRFVLSGIPRGTFSVRIAPVAIVPSVVPHESSVSIVSSDTLDIGTVVVSEVYSAWLHRGVVRCDLSSITSEEEPLANFPVLLRLDSANFDFSQADANGTDIRFATVGGKPLAYEIETWDAARKRAAIWIQVDSLSVGVVDSCRMYWGCSDVASRSSSQDLFGAGHGFAGVWHCSSAGEILNASGAENPGTIVKPLSVTEPDGVGGTALGLSDSSHVNVGLINGSTALTLEAWVRPSAFNGWDHVVAKPSSEALAPWLAWGLQLTNDTSPFAAFAVTTDAGDSSIVSNTPIPLAVWTYVCGVYDGASLKIFVNGQLEDSVPFSGSIVQNDSAVTFGFNEHSPDQYLTGDIDEVRISQTARRNGWVQACALTERPQSSTVTLIREK